jgi:hypothetical protein
LNILKALVTSYGKCFFPHPRSFSQGEGGQAIEYFSILALTPEKKNGYSSGLVLCPLSFGKGQGEVP